MVQLKTLWYRLVARDIVGKLASREDDYQTLLEAYVVQARETNSVKLSLVIAQQETKEWQKRATAKDDVQVMRDRINHNPCILNAREIAATQRINDLEIENYNLKKDNTKLRREQAERFIDPYDH